MSQLLKCAVGQCFILHWAGKAPNYNFTKYFSFFSNFTKFFRLLMVDLGEDEEKFDAFMAPLTQTFENLGNVLLNSTRY